MESLQPRAVPENPIVWLDSPVEDLAPSTSIGAEAASIFEFLASLRAMPDASLHTHGPQGDLATWVVGARGNEDLSMHLHQLAQRPLGGAGFRQAPE